MMSHESPRAREAVREITLKVESALEGRADRQDAVSALLRVQRRISRKLRELNALMRRANRRHKRRLAQRAAATVDDMTACLSQLSVLRTKLTARKHRLGFETGPSYLAYHDFQWRRSHKEDKDV